MAYDPNNPYDFGTSGFDFSNNPYLGQFSQIAQGATQGTLNNFNTAANDLRTRIDSQTAGNVNDVTQRNLSRGFGASGLNDADVQTTQRAGQDAYAQGLGNLSSLFEDRRLQGLGIASNAIAQGASDISQQQIASGHDDASRYAADQGLSGVKYSADHTDLRSALDMLRSLGISVGGGSGSGGTSQNPGHGDPVAPGNPNNGGSAGGSGSGSASWPSNWGNPIIGKPATTTSGAPIAEGTVQANGFGQTFKVVNGKWTLVS